MLLWYELWRVWWSVVIAARSSISLHGGTSYQWWLLKMLRCDVQKQRNYQQAYFIPSETGIFKVLTFRLNIRVLFNFSNIFSFVKIRCQICELQYKSLIGLRAHLNIHLAHIEGKFKCKKCNKNFSRKSHYISHTKIHHGISKWKSSELNSFKNNFLNAPFPFLVEK